MFHKFVGTFVELEANMTRSPMQLQVYNITCMVDSGGAGMDSTLSLWSMVKEVALHLQILCGYVYVIQQVVRGVRLLVIKGLYHCLAVTANYGMCRKAVD